MLLVSAPIPPVKEVCIHIESLALKQVISKEQRTQAQQPPAIEEETLVGDEDQGSPYVTVQAEKREAKILKSTSSPPRKTPRFWGVHRSPQRGVENCCTVRRSSPPCQS
ncbi:MAG: hypothetical protein QXO71_10690 [Candidatus Jordarchaeaceae archaeon]